MEGLPREEYGGNERWIKFVAFWNSKECDSVLIGRHRNDTLGNQSARGSWTVRNGQRAMDMEWWCEVDRKTKTIHPGSNRERNSGMQLRHNGSSR